MEGKLGRQIHTFKSSHQGKVKASGHFKAYVNPFLVALGNPGLGFAMGPLFVTAVCIADDILLQCDCPRKFQADIDFVEQFNASNTKVTLTRSKTNMQDYKEVKMWALNGDTIDVNEDNAQRGEVMFFSQNVVLRKYNAYKMLP